MTRRVFPDIA